MVPKIEAKRYIREGIQGWIHQPAKPTGSGVLLAHGAGSNSGAPLLVALCEAFSARGVTALRIDLPFRQARPHGPPHPSTAAADREGIRRAAAALRAEGIEELAIGGHSYGGRQATMLAADEPEVASRLLILSYPLHPPGKPEKPRVAHLPGLRTPSLFVHGLRDPFGSIEELRNALTTVPAPWRLIEIDGAGHELARKGKEAGVAERIAGEFAGAPFEA
ncbi:MAG TPA: alpha/beta hydrolase [Solibacterales bacterium]|nr:alpha/beta hydrolase [Bryobacterales bacterium]